jgi:hypothetical protein
MALAISGCDSAAIEACEKFVKDSLSSPSSYSRVSITEHTQPISIAELHELRPPSAMDQILEGERSLYLVGIEYDAENAFGASLRSANVCAFEMRNGELPSDEAIRTKARMSARRVSLRGMVDSGIVPEAEPGSLGEARKYDCCL